MNRATKSQQILLNYINEFTRQHHFGPSYREIMRALDYKSVSTVAIHINALIAKGFLRKRDRSARSLEVVAAAESQPSAPEMLSEHVKNRLETCTRHELETLVKSFQILKLAELEVAAKQKLAVQD